jgi:hypothetical protein
MSIPLAPLRYFTPRTLLVAPFAVGGSTLIAWLLFPILARYTDAKTVDYDRAGDRRASG